jgi:hypothetical protein
MTYVRKGARLKSEVIIPRINRDLLWVNVKGYSALNELYLQPLSNTVLLYITNLARSMRRAGVSAFWALLTIEPP